MFSSEKSKKKGRRSRKRSTSASEDGSPPHHTLKSIKERKLAERSRSKSALRRKEEALIKSIKQKEEALKKVARSPENHGTYSSASRHGTPEKSKGSKRRMSNSPENYKRRSRSSSMPDSSPKRKGRSRSRGKGKSKSPEKKKSTKKLKRRKKSPDLSEGEISLPPAKKIKKDKKKSSQHPPPSPEYIPTTQARSTEYGQSSQNGPNSPQYRPSSPAGSPEYRPTTPSQHSPEYRPTAPSTALSGRSPEYMPTSTVLKSLSKAYNSPEYTPSSSSGYEIKAEPFLSPPEYIPKSSKNKSVSDQSHQRGVCSPPRASKSRGKGVCSPPRERGDFSPPRELKSRGKGVCSPLRESKSRGKGVCSPPRESNSRGKGVCSPPREYKSRGKGVCSPPRESKSRGKGVCSPPRESKSRGKGVCSPPRGSKYRGKGVCSPPREFKSRGKGVCSPPRESKSRGKGVCSPPREFKSRGKGVCSPPRESRSREKGVCSPPRESKSRGKGICSPPRGSKYRGKGVCSPPRESKSRGKGVCSPPRESKSRGKGVCSPPRESKSRGKGVCSPPRDLKSKTSKSKRKDLPMLPDPFNLKDLQPSSSKSRHPSNGSSVREYSPPPRSASKSTRPPGDLSPTNRSSSSKRMSSRDTRDISQSSSHSVSLIPGTSSQDSFTPLMIKTELDTDENGVEILRPQVITGVYFKPDRRQVDLRPGYAYCHICESQYLDNEDEKNSHLKTTHKLSAFKVTVPKDIFLCDMEEVIRHYATFGIDNGDICDKLFQNNLVVNPPTLEAFTCGKCPEGQRFTDFSDLQKCRDHIRVTCKVLNNPDEHVIPWCRGCHCRYKSIQEMYEHQMCSQNYNHERKDITHCFLPKPEVRRIYDEVKNKPMTQLDPEVKREIKRESEHAALQSQLQEVLASQTGPAINAYKNFNENIDGTTTVDTPFNIFDDMDPTEDRSRSRSRAPSVADMRGMLALANSNMLLAPAGINAGVHVPDMSCPPPGFGYQMYPPTVDYTTQQTYPPLAQQSYPPSNVYDSQPLRQQSYPPSNLQISPPAQDFRMPLSASLGPSHPGYHNAPAGFFGNSQPTQQPKTMLAVGAAIQRARSQVLDVKREPESQVKMSEVLQSQVMSSQQDTRRSHSRTSLSPTPAYPTSQQDSRRSHSTRAPSPSPAYSPLQQDYRRSPSPLPSYPSPTSTTDPPAAKARPAVPTPSKLIFQPPAPSLPLLSREDLFKDAAIAPPSRINLAPVASSSYDGGRALPSLQNHVHAVAPLERPMSANSSCYSVNSEDSRSNRPNSVSPIRVVDEEKCRTSSCRWDDRHSGECSKPVIKIRCASESCKNHDQNPKDLHQNSGPNSCPNLEKVCQYNPKTCPMILLEMRQGKRDDSKAEDRRIPFRLLYKKTSTVLGDPRCRDGSYPQKSPNPPPDRTLALSTGPGKPPQHVPGMTVTRPLHPGQFRTVYAWSILSTNRLSFNANHNPHAMVESDDEIEVEYEGPQMTAMQEKEVDVIEVKPGKQLRNRQSIEVGECSGQM